MTDAETADTDAEAGAAKKDEKPAKRSRSSRKSIRAGADAVRSRVATLVWLVAVVCALFLAVGALLVALGANQDNAIVSFVLSTADRLDLGVFGRTGGVFEFAKDPDGVRSALVNWGIAAIAYLVVGKLLDRVIRP